MEALGNKKCKVQNNTEDQKKCSRVKIKKNLTWFTKTGYFHRQLMAKIACMNMDAATKINREFNQKKRSTEKLQISLIHSSLQKEISISQNFYILITQKIQNGFLSTPSPIVQHMTKGHPQTMAIITRKCSL